MFIKAAEKTRNRPNLLVRRSLVVYQFFVTLPSLPGVVKPIIKNPLLFGGLSLFIQITRRFSDYAIIVKRIPEIVELRSEEHTSELQSLMRISYAVFCLKKTKPTPKPTH